MQIDTQHLHRPDIGSLKTDDVFQQDRLAAATHADHDEAFSGGDRKSVV